MLLDAKDIDGQLAAQRGGRGESHGDTPDPAGVVDAQYAEHLVRADRHRAQAVGEDKVETGSAGHVDVEMVSGPVAGQLGVATGDVRVDVVPDGAEWAGPRLVGKSVLGRRRAEI